MTYDQWKDPTDCGPDEPLLCESCEEPLQPNETVQCTNCLERAYERQQERLMEDGSGPSLLEQQRAAYKIKHGLQ